MLLGVVSDTHNNHKNIKKIISLFNDRRVDLVIHTGDVTNAASLSLFSELTSNFYVVLGNNDRNENDLEEIAKKNNFFISEPPMTLSIANRKIAVFHEPDDIYTFLNDNPHYDLILHGHTHRYRKENIENSLLFNPGESAGMLTGRNAIGIIDLSNLSLERIFF